MSRIGITIANSRIQRRRGLLTLTPLPRSPELTPQNAPCGSGKPRLLESACQHFTARLAAKRSRMTKVDIAFLHSSLLSAVQATKYTLIIISVDSSSSCHSSHFSTFPTGQTNWSRWLPKLSSLAAAVSSTLTLLIRFWIGRQWHPASRLPSCCHCSLPRHSDSPPSHVQSD